MNKWEYKNIYCNESNQDLNNFLNGYGEDGWELVDHYCYAPAYTSNHYFIFKRPLQDDVFRTKDPKRFDEQAKKVLNET